MSVATLAIDVSALLAAGVVVHAPPPALITARNAEHVGLTPRQLADALRAMRRDPRWADRVIAHGKVRAVAPADLVSYMRASSVAPSSASSTPSDDTAVSEELLARWGVTSSADGSARQ